ncbi:unnamed protein product, partial [Closterium sp. NIES-54]
RPNIPILLHSFQFPFPPALAETAACRSAQASFEAPPQLLSSSFEAPAQLHSPLLPTRPYPWSSHPYTTPPPFHPFQWPVVSASALAFFGPAHMRPFPPTPPSIHQSPPSAHPPAALTPQSSQKSAPSFHQSSYHSAPTSHDPATPPPATLAATPPRNSPRKHLSPQSHRMLSPQSQQLPSHQHLRPLSPLSSPTDPQGSAALGGPGEVGGSAELWHDSDCIKGHMKEGNSESGSGGAGSMACDYSGIGTVNMVTVTAGATATTEACDKNELPAVRPRLVRLVPAASRSFTFGDQYKRALASAAMAGIDRVTSSGASSREDAAFASHLITNKWVTSNAVTSTWVDAAEERQGGEPGETRTSKNSPPRDEGRRIDRYGDYDSKRFKSFSADHFRTITSPGDSEDGDYNGGGGGSSLREPTRKLRQGTDEEEGAAAGGVGVGTTGMGEAGCGTSTSASAAAAAAAGGGAGAPASAGAAVAAAGVGGAAPHPSISSGTIAMVETHQTPLEPGGSTTHVATADGAAHDAARAAAAAAAAVDGAANGASSNGDDRVTNGEALPNAFDPVTTADIDISFVLAAEPHSITGDAAACQFGELGFEFGQSLLLEPFAAAVQAVGPVNLTEAGRDLAATHSLTPGTAHDLTATHPGSTDLRTCDSGIKDQYGDGPIAEDRQ